MYAYCLPDGRLIDMKDIRRALAGALTAAILSGSPAAFPVHAEDPLALRISKVEITKETIREDRLLSVDVEIEGNERGFLAAEFGIVYDSRLTLQTITPCCDAAECFSYSSTSKNHMIWFSGSNIRAASGATEGSVKFFTLDFVLPDSYAVGDVFAIDYEWEGMDGAPGFWYTDRKQDQITSLMQYSRTGFVSLPSPDAPRLDMTSVTLNQNSTCKLSVQNSAEEGIWFSDNDAVASVADGVITAKSPGNCVISVFLGDSSSLLTCDVTVRKEYRYSMFDTEPVVITSREQQVFLEYPNAVGSVTWISTNPNIITVDNGRLNILTSGSAQIIASNNGISKMRNVMVQLDDPTEATTQPVTVQTSTLAPRDLQMGDVNGDESVDIVDVITLNKYLIGSVQLDKAQRRAADVYLDNEVNSSDALILLKYVVDILKSLPVKP